MRARWFLAPLRRRHGMTSRHARLIRTVIGPASYDEVGIALKFLGRTAGEGWVVDVGAHIGDSSRPFAARGWRVLAVEPDPANRSRLAALATDHPSVKIDLR